MVFGIKPVLWFTSQILLQDLDQRLWAGESVTSTLAPKENFASAEVSFMLC